SMELFLRYRDASDDDTRRERRDAITAEHTALASHLSHRCNHRGISAGDLMQVASIGLIHAVQGSGRPRCLQFCSFPAPSRLGAPKRHSRDRGWAIRIPRRLQELNLRLATVADDLTHQLGRSPTIAELASAVHTSDEEVLEALDAARAYRARPFGKVGDDDG